MPKELPKELSEDFQKKVDAPYERNGRRPRVLDTFERRAKEKDKNIGDKILIEIDDAMTKIKENVKKMNHHFEKLTAFVDMFENEKDNFSRNNTMISYIRRDIVMNRNHRRKSQEVENAYIEGRNFGIILNSYHRSRNEFTDIRGDIRYEIRMIEANIKSIEGLDFYKLDYETMQGIKEFQEKYSDILEKKAREFQEYLERRQPTISDLETSRILANLARALVTNTCSIHCKKKRSELGRSGKIERESLRIVGKGMRCPDVDMKITNRLMIGKNCAQSL